MLRLFVGLELPQAIRTRLALLAGGLPGAKWVPAENYHLTLRFIGEVEGWRADEVDAALDAIEAPSFEIALSGLGCFEKSRRPHSLWVGVEKNAALLHLQRKVETAMQRIGLEAERRSYVPHVSIAKLDNPPAPRLSAFLQAHNLFRAGPVAVDRFVLFSSHLGRERAHYRAEAEYDLDRTGAWADEGA
ncbi:MAG: RNA 2',3'-cyclic phosphodiesterase [Alphaproteobacteria bacterium]|nr:RNA 2',3'-cyclic phosphodiesterase [Alphaproteobacteria bacterium]